MIEEKRRIIHSIIYPAIFVVLLWLVKLIEVITRADFSAFGLLPLHAKGLLGIITAPFLHAGFSHLSANSVPLFILGGLLFYFYRELAWRIIIMVWLITGIWVWVFARGDAVHIGASGIVYGLAAFLFLSGILRRDTKLMAITLLITFTYGGMVWGVFPQLFPRENISWESHLMGILAGVVLAIFYRKAGPQRKQYEWETEEDEDEGSDTFENNDQGSNSKSGPDIHYHYKE